MMSDALTTTQSSSTARNKDNLLRILVATDIHLGYEEKNQILTGDSFNTFEEILEIANSRDVDMILLGGDLFHDPTPTPNALNKCLKLLRTYVLGDKMIDFEFLSDPNLNFPSSFNQSVNYEDANLNVSVPVFSIHGNHDDVTGTGRLSSMDILSTAGYINYFGKWRNLSEVEIAPIVLRKNETKVALYGLSHIHDARLARLFRDHKVNVRKPDIPDEDVFNLMVLHQNRADRGRFNFLPEDKLPGFLDLIIWGHEHDCRIEPEPNGKTKAYISQPGSSVATSLSEGESIEKNIGILEIHQKEFKLTAVKLKTVRPFIFRTVNIDEFVDPLRLNEGDFRQKVENFYDKNVLEMINESKKKLSGHPKQPIIPLLRLRIIYTNEKHIINAARFGQKYCNKVANVDSILAFKKAKSKKEFSAYNPDKATLKASYDKREQKDSVEDVVASYFGNLVNEKDKLQLLSLDSLTEVCRLLVDKNDESAAENIVESMLTKYIEFLEEKVCSAENIPAAIQEFRLKKSGEAFDQAIIENSRAIQNQERNDISIESESSSHHKSISAPTRETRGRGGSASSRTKCKKIAPPKNDLSLNIVTNRSKTTRQPVAKK